MNNGLKIWKDVKVGDTVYFADRFAELEPVTVEKIVSKERKPYLHIFVTGEAFHGEMKEFDVLLLTDHESMSAAFRAKDEILAGRLYISVDAYKNAWTKKFAEQLNDLERDRALIEERIDNIKKDIEIVANMDREKI